MASKAQKIESKTDSKKPKDRHPVDKKMRSIAKPGSKAQFNRMLAMSILPKKAAADKGKDQKQSDAAKS